MKTDTFWWKAMDWIADYVMPSILVIGLCVLLITGLVFAGYEAWVHFGTPPEEKIELTAKYWSCTNSHSHYVEPYTCGAKIHRTCGGYSESVCDQWSALMVDGSVCCAGRAEP